MVDLDDLGRPHSAHSAYSATDLKILRHSRLKNLMVKIFFSPDRAENSRPRPTKTLRHSRLDENIFKIFLNFFCQFLFKFFLTNFV